MTAAVLFGLFFVLLLAGVPIFAAIGVAAIASIGASDLGVMAVAINVQAALTKYPFLAAPMFILTGAILERSGIATRLLTLAMAIVGRGPGSLAAVAVVMCILMGGISGSSVAIAATVGGIMTSSMLRAGYPRGFIATIIGAGAATDVLVPPSIALIIYSMLVPAATVPAMFAAGLVPGTLAGLMMVLPVYLIARRHGFGHASEGPRPPFWKSLFDASWGLFAKVLILVGLRFGWFTPTEAGVIAVAYSLFVASCIYRTITLRDVREMLLHSAEMTAVILILIAFAAVFGWTVNAIGIVDPIVAWISGLPIGQYGVLALIVVLLFIAGMFLEGTSIFLIFLPILIPIANVFHWDVVWFGIILTLKIALGQFTPPMAVNLMVTTRIAGTGMESTFRWVGWPLLTMLLTLVAVVAFPQIALWLPRTLGLLR